MNFHLFSRTKVVMKKIIFYFRLTICVLGNLPSFCCRLLTFFKIIFFQRTLSGTLTECQMVWNQMIWVRQHLHNTPNTIDLQAEFLAAFKRGFLFVLMLYIFIHVKTISCLLRLNKKCHKHVTNAPKGIGLA